jgi:hypothetical protein
MVQITSKLLKDLRPEIEDALRGVSEKYGITMKLGNGHYGGLSGDYKLELTTTGEDGETAESRDFKLYAERFGLRPEWYGKTFQSNGFTYTITAIYPRKRKRPIGLIRSDGSKRILDETSVRRMMLRAGYDVPYYYGDNVVAWLNTPPLPQGTLTLGTPPTKKPRAKVTK